MSTRAEITAPFQLEEGLWFRHPEAAETLKLTSSGQETCPKRDTFYEHLKSVSYRKLPES